MRTYIFTNLYLNKLTVYILIKVITLDPGRYFLKHWMRVLPIENSARGGFIPTSKGSSTAGVDPLLESPELYEKFSTAPDL